MPKGAVVTIKISTNGLSVEYDNTYLAMLVTQWKCLTKNNYIKPFEILKFDTLDQVLHIEIKNTKKDEEVDVVRLYCQDIVHLLNSDNILVESIFVRKP